MSRNTNVIPFRQPDAVDNALNERAREGARRIARWPRPGRASRPRAASGDPDRGWACRDLSRNANSCPC